MSAIRKLPKHQMTVAEFLDWTPEDGAGAIWQLRDGEPEMMAPASESHGSIQNELAYLITRHLIARGSRWRSVITPGVIPRPLSDHNMLAPDIGITCSPPASRRSLPNPMVLIEILSPSNETQTRANVHAYTTIPSVAEIVIVDSVAVGAEILRRQPDGTWPEQPEIVSGDGALRIAAIGFAVPLREVYRTSGVL